MKEGMALLYSTQASIHQVSSWSISSQLKTALMSLVCSLAVSATAQDGNNEPFWQQLAGLRLVEAAKPSLDLVRLHTRGWNLDWNACTSSIESSCIMFRTLVSNERKRELDGGPLGPQGFVIRAVASYSLFPD